MKKLILGIFAIGLMQSGTAQKKTKNAVKFTPPVIKKDQAVSNDKVKFTPPVLKKN